MERYTKQTKKKSDEKEKQPYIIGYKSRNLTETIGSKKAQNENGAKKYATKVNKIPQANEWIKQSKKGKKRKQKPNENKK